MKNSIKNVTGIKFQGKNFDHETELQLFKENTLIRISLIYGKNGSGKSTIASAFDKVKGSDISDIITAELIGQDNSNILLNDNEKNNIFVFDETYILKNIRMKEDGLDIIVMLGEMKEIEEQLEKLEEEKHKLDKGKEEQEKFCNDLNDDKNEISPKYWLNKIIRNLKGKDNKGNNNWAERDLEIRQSAGGNSRKAASVSDDAYKDFISLSPNKSRDDLLIEYNKLLGKLKATQKGTNAITSKVKTDYPFNFDENQFRQLLLKKIEQPIFSEREKFLISIMAERKEQHLHDIRATFSNTENNQCPFCTQEVSSNYKKEILKSIEKILSKAAEEHKIELQRYKLEEIIVNFDEFVVLNTVNECKIILDEFNTLVKLVNKKIDEKLENVYQPVIIKDINILSKFNILISALKKLEELRIEYNKKSTDITFIKNQLNDINNDIAYYDIYDEHKKYKEKLEKQDNENKKLQKYINKSKEYEQKITELTAQKKNIEIAMEEINNGLKYIFFADNRLELEYRNEKYYLKSMGSNVKPNKVSTGERNAIAMCYFFSQLMQNKKENNRYSEPYLLVIDDPISSFDLENRIGLLSFLRYQLKEYLCGNKSTKAVILTHDIQTYFDLKQIANDIKFDSNLSLLELKRKELVDFSKRRHEYTELLKEIYNFAIDPTSNDFSLTIGNVMRKVLEAYGTFVYKKGITEISTDKEILLTIKDSNIAKYFENLMYRLVLHGESHLEERTKSVHNDLNFFQFVSDEEKQRTAKSIICFLYCLNKLHVLTHLGEDKETQIDKWIEEIKK